MSDAEALLFVDDAPFFRTMLGPVLKAAGFNVTSVESAAEGLKLFDDGRRFDVVVSDIEMPCTPQRVWKAIQSAGSSGGGAADEAQPHFADGAPNHDPAAGATDGAGQ